MTHRCPHCAIIDVLNQHWAEHGAEICREMAETGMIPVEKIDPETARSATTVLALSQCVGEMLASTPEEQRVESLQYFLENMTRHAGGGVLVTTDSVASLTEH